MIFIAREKGIGLPATSSEIQLIPKLIKVPQKAETIMAK